MSTADAPFRDLWPVPVAGGELAVALAGPPASDANRVVLLVHGITASHVAWRAVTRSLIEDGATCVLAPDLRGRGASASLPGPYGSAAHVNDLLTVLEHAGVPPVILAGHSMGAYVAARLAAEHPEHVSGLLLVDGGLSLPIPDDADPDELLRKTLGPALERLEQTFASRDDYISMWRRHPAFAASWNSDVEAYVAYDLEPAAAAATPEALRSVVSADAVWTDGRELVLDEPTRTAADQVRIPMHLLRAPRGLLDDDRPLIPEQVADDFRAAHPGAGSETVADTNHYTLLLGDGPGPTRVVKALRRVSRSPAGCH